ncbi:ABC transporter permease [Roseimaritima ulvae]|uniref:Bicarbonate transport system permease protein CmpB n=1 Tax=Roseimaritima ulvae TaxID=980254 RepID=A0A5B9QYU9_9BACT|nr:ABC transporter permease [Roseimaritima ulvae]QEG43030.1 Bicarbonate transport system permease protein CmpB [Roseimaritima ulvae]
MNWRGKALRFCEISGLPILEPFVRLLAGEEPKEQMKGIAKFLFLPAIAIVGFLFLWSSAAQTVVTKNMKLPGPQETWDAGVQLFEMHARQRADDESKRREKRADAIVVMVEALQVESAAAEASPEQREKMLAHVAVLKKQAVQLANYQPSSAPTFVDQIYTSLGTVFFGFFLATVVAVPLGVMCGMSPWFNAALTPAIQIFKPVSPLAWLPLASLVVIWYYNDTPPEGAFFSKAFLISAATVSLCSLWPTLVNTAFGVASVDQDYLNVARVLKLTWTQKLFKIILPASLPLMFAGLRISLGVGWMVLIAADMLAQNPGLGKFVWDEFQNGSSLTYSRIAFSVLIIGLIGLVLDRLMICLRNLVSFGNPAAA